MPRLRRPSHDCLFDEPSLSANFHSPERRLRTCNQDGESGIPAQMAGFDVIRSDPHVEASVAPLMPDR